MAAGRLILSTADARRPLVVAAALREFARAGFHGTTVAAIAGEAGISSAYVFKLFPGKERLFVAAVESCFDEIITVLEKAAFGANEDTADALFHVWRRAYARLIDDRTLLMLQVHAQSVATISEVETALRAGLARLTTFIKTRSGGSDDSVHAFISYAQLCHLIASARLLESTDPVATILTQAVRPSSDFRSAG